MIEKPGVLRETVRPVRLKEENTYRRLPCKVIIFYVSKKIIENTPAFNHGCSIDIFTDFIDDRARLQECFFPVEQTNGRIEESLRIIKVILHRFFKRRQCFVI